MLSTVSFWGRCRFLIEDSPSGSHELMDSMLSWKLRGAGVEDSSCRKCHDPPPFHRKVQKLKDAFYPTPIRMEFRRPVYGSARCSSLVWQWAALVSWVAYTTLL